MAGAPPSRSGIAWDDHEHSHTFEYSTNYIGIRISISPLKQYLSAVNKMVKTSHIIRAFIQPMPTFKKNIYKKVKKIVGIG